MPTIDIPDKVCPHCGGIRWVIFNCSKKNKHGGVRSYPAYRCAKKNTEGTQRWRDNHREHHRKTRRESVKLKRVVCEEFRLKDLARAALYYKNNKESVDTYTKKWREENKNKVKEYSLRNMKRQISEITDYYAKRLLMESSDLKSEDIPKNLVEIQRKQLLLKRQIKAHGKAN